MARNQVAQALVAPPGRLATPQTGVGMPKPLSPQIPFGNLSPSIVTGSRFSGAVSPGGGFNVVHPPAPATFQAPRYSSPGAIAPPRALSPIAAALTGSGATGGPPTPPPPGQSPYGPQPVTYGPSPNLTRGPGTFQPGIPVTTTSSIGGGTRDPGTFVPGPGPYSLPTSGPTLSQQLATAALRGRMRMQF
jgi:hypothetical protein